MCIEIGTSLSLSLSLSMALHIDACTHTQADVLIHDCVVFTCASMCGCTKDVCAACIQALMCAHVPTYLPTDLPTYLATLNPKP